MQPTPDLTFDVYEGQSHLDLGCINAFGGLVGPRPVIFRVVVIVLGL